MAQSERRIVNLGDAAIELHLGGRVVRLAAFGELALPTLDDRQRAQVDALAASYRVAIRTARIDEPVAPAARRPARKVPATKKATAKKATAKKTTVTKATTKKAAATTTARPRRGS
ncbi:MAG: hypothetical protein H0U21_16165 [Acidimicrobiia bacterium]|nr:hypothetical protein [Acidimicrobiia bacterium]